MDSCSRITQVKRGCAKSPTIENVAKFYFDFRGEDLPGFLKPGRSNARIELNFVDNPGPNHLTQLFLPLERNFNLFVF